MFVKWPLVILMNNRICESNIAVCESATFQAGTIMPTFDIKRIRLWWIYQYGSAVGHEEVDSSGNTTCVYSVKRVLQNLEDTDYSIIESKWYEVLALEHTVYWTQTIFI